MIEPRQEPATGRRSHLDNVLDFGCGSGSLLLNVRHRMGPHGIGKIYGREKNMTTYNLARTNMLLHGVKDSEFLDEHIEKIVTYQSLASNDSISQCRI